MEEQEESEEEAEEEDRMEASELWQHKDWHSEKETVGSHPQNMVGTVHTQTTSHCLCNALCVMHIHQRCYRHTGLEQHSGRTTWAEYKSAGRKRESFKCRGVLPASLPPTKQTKPLTLPPLARGSIHSAQTS